MGPQGKDPECPCKMIDKGLQPHNIWDDETVKRFYRAIDDMFDRNKQAK